MPAVTFMHSTVHSSQNCGVRQATRGRHLVRGHQFPGMLGRHPPGGLQPAAGTRTLTTPIIMNMK